MYREPDQGSAPEEANECGGEDDGGDREEDSGDDCEGKCKQDLQQVEDTGGEGAESVQHQGGKELQEILWQ